MIQETRALIIALLVINFIVAVIYLILNIAKKPVGQKLFMFTFFLIFPIVGELFILLAKLCGILINMVKDGGLNMSELSFSKERIHVLTDVDVDKALNSVPIEEALIVSKKADKREAFVDVLKSENYNYMMGQIKTAVENKDSEVAHYAAAFVTHSLAKFKEEEKKLRKNIDKDYSIEAISDYVNYMHENLEASLFSTVELKVYVELFEKAASLLYARKPEKLSDFTITKLVELLDQIDNQDRSDVWVVRARARFRGSLECFKVCARYYFKHGDINQLREMMSEIKVLSVPLDSEALEWVRMLRL